MDQRLFKVKVRPDGVPGKSLITVTEIPTNQPLFGWAGIFVTISGLAALVAWMMAWASLFPAIIALYATRFPLFPLLLTIGALLLLISREGRRHWVKITLMAISSVLLVPLSFFSFWAIRTDFGTWQQIASFPFVPIFAAAVVVLTAVKRAWPGAVAGGLLLIASSLPYLFVLGQTDLQTGEQLLLVNSAAGYDNVISLLNFLIMAGIADIAIRGIVRNQVENEARRTMPQPQV